MKESKTIQAVPGSGVVWQAFRAAAPQTVPVFAGYLVLGMGYGIYVQSLGLPVWMPMLMGTVVYGGSLEFVLASLLLGTFSPLSAFLMALMIQARHRYTGLLGGGAVLPYSECGQAHHPHGCPAAHFQRDHRCQEEPAGQRDLCP